jgi:hypothetical protein
MACNPQVVQIGVWTSCVRRSNPWVASLKLTSAAVWVAPGTSRAGSCCGIVCSSGPGCPQTRHNPVLVLALRPWASSAQNRWADSVACRNLPAARNATSWLPASPSGRMSLVACPSA